MMKGIYFSEHTWPELDEMIKRNSIVLLPLGTVEEHGKHLPINADEAIATQVAKRVGERMAKQLPILVMPTIWTGYSMSVMQKWPGTIRVRPEILIELLCDVIGSLVTMGLKRIVLISTHGHHAGITRVVARKVADAYGVYIAVTSPAAFAVEVMREKRKTLPGGSIHAGEYETALMRYFGYEIDEKELTKEDTFNYHTDFVAGDNFVSGSKVFWSTFGLQESKTGAYGDPTTATAELGEALMEAILDAYERFLNEFWEFHESQTSALGFQKKR